MNLIRVQYNGWKPYTDRTPMKTIWQPGDSKLVPEQYARKGAYALLKFAEFSEVTIDTAAAQAPQNPPPPPPPDNTKTPEELEAERVAAEEAAAKAKAEAEEVAAAQAKAEAIAAKAAEESQQRENMLVEIGTWNKDTLAEYAAKYDTKIDKRLAVADLRQQVSGLVEQFGVR